MKEGIARFYCRMGYIYYILALCEWAYFFIRFFVGHVDANDLLMPWLDAAGGYALQRIGKRTLSQIEAKKADATAIEGAKIEPFIRIPGRNQCPVCGLEDLADYRLWDQHLALTGDEKYIQKWGDHDAHWSCVQTCPYIPSREEINKKEHEGGMHPNFVEGCEGCRKRKRRAQIAREDWDIPGCYCHKCLRRVTQEGYAVYGHGTVSDLYYRYNLGPSDEYNHYSKMAAHSDDPDVKAYAYEKLIELQEKQ